MHAWAPLMIAAACLLIAGGIPKLSRPGPAVQALRSIGLTRVGGTTIRCLAILEIGVGSAAIAVGDRATDIAVGTLYAGFTGFLVLALRRAETSCGCAGADDTPPTAGHLVMTAMFTTAAIAAAVAGSGVGVLGLGRSAGLVTTLTAAVMAAVVAAIGWAVLTISPRLAAMRRP